MNSDGNQLLPQRIHPFMAAIPPQKVLTAMNPTAVTITIVPKVATVAAENPAAVVPAQIIQIDFLFQIYPTSGRYQASNLKSS